MVFITKHSKLFIFILVGLILIVVYKVYDPISSHLFPKCPFHMLTGWLCPGCGSQRAIHHLLNFEIVEATKQNFLLVASIPYILTGFLVDNVSSNNAKIINLRKKIYSARVIYGILAVVLLFWILRNVVSIP